MRLLPVPGPKQPRTDLDELMGWLAGLVPGTDTAAQPGPGSLPGRGSHKPIFFIFFCEI